jgi:hypothetical protein
MLCLIKMSMARQLDGGRLDRQSYPWSIFHRIEFRQNWINGDTRLGMLGASCPRDSKKAPKRRLST